MCCIWKYISLKNIKSICQREVGEQLLAKVDWNDFWVSILDLPFAVGTEHFPVLLRDPPLSKYVRSSRIPDCWERTFICKYGYEMIKKNNNNKINY